MKSIISFETVNFYGDYLDVAVTDNNEAHVSVAQITGYLGLDIESITNMFDNDPRVNLETLDGALTVSLYRLNGFLMLLPYSDVPDDLKDDLLRYQVECFDALHDYWIHGVALNRRETPYDVTSKFKDERAVSRAALTKACADYGSGTDLDPDDIFNNVLVNSYKVVGIEPLNEFEKLSGAEAKYLAWVEAVFAKTISKFAKFGEVYENPVEEALAHVENHLRETGYAWIAMADTVPVSAYH